MEIQFFVVRFQICARGVFKLSVRFLRFKKLTLFWQESRNLIFGGSDFESIFGVLILGLKLSSK